MERTATREKARPLIGLGGVLAALPLVAAIVCLGTLLLLLQTSRITSAGYGNQRLQQQRDALLYENDQLEAETGALRSLERIEHEARARLGMAPASAANLVYLTVDVPSLGLPPEAVAPADDEQAPTGSRPWWRRVWEWIIFR